MASSNAPSTDKTQKKANKQSARRVVPVIPRQLVRPKKQISEAKEVQERVVKAQDKISVPKTEPAAVAAVEREAASAQQPTSQDDEGKVPTEDFQRVNGRVTDEAVTDAAQEQPSTSETSVKETDVDQAPADQPKPEQTNLENVRGQDQEQAAAAVKLPSSPSKPVKPVRAPLPPPFVPSRDLHRFSLVSTTTVPASATFPGAPHPAQPNVEALMFGGYRDSANISPASMQMSASPHPPPLINGAPVPVPSAHMPHFSGDFNSSHYPMSVNVAAPVLQPVQGFISPVNVAPASFTRPHVNGVNYMSRTPSQASSVAFDASLGHHSNSGIITPEFSAHHHHHESGYDSRQIAPPQRLSHSAAQTPATQQTPMQSDLANMQAMKHYLLDRFGNYDFADYVLDLAVNRSLPVHSILLARSSGLRGILHRARKDEGSQYWRLRISTDEYFREPDAFVDAVRFLYGGDLLDVSYLFQALPAVEAGSRKSENELKARMTYVLSYVAAGLTLDMPEIHVHGVQIADRLLRWENIEPVLELSLNSHFQHTIAVQHILHTAVDFIILNFPVHFALDTSAPQLQSLPRLVEQQNQQADADPSLFPQGRRQSHHRLKSIRFGDASPGQEIPLQASILSSVLISLPFEILTNIFQSLPLRDRLGSVLVSQHMYAVVGERERRRTGSLRAYGHLPDHAQNVDPVIIQNFGWEESVEQSDGDAVGLRIVRRRVEDASSNGHQHR